MDPHFSSNLIPAEYTDLRIHLLFLVRELEEKKRQEKKQLKTLLFLQKQNTELHEEIINKDKHISILLNKFESK
jgi:hypothetical protein